MMRLYAALVFLVVVGYSAGAQDRIAVLDTELPKGMDTKVVIPITEKLMEEFVRSKKFTVVDRSFIAKTLSELEFSTSDLTSGDTDKLATIGGFLKATYIVVSTVQLLDRTFFLSAKMIEVKTGIISAQASVNRDGPVSVLIDMAGELGRKLVAAALGQELQPDTRTATQQTGTSSARQPREPPARSERFSTISADFGTGAFIGTSGLSYGVSTMFPSGLFYISGGAELIDTYDSDNSFEYYYTDFDIFLGAGVNFILGPVQIYAGPRVSYTAITLSIYDYYLNEDYSSYSGIGYGFELGADIRIGPFAIGGRYSSLWGDVEYEYDYSSYPFDNGALMLRLSWAF